MCRSGATWPSCPSRAMDGSIARRRRRTPVADAARPRHRQPARRLRRQARRRLRRHRAPDAAQLRPIRTGCMACGFSTSAIRGSPARSRACRPAAVRTRIRSSRIPTTRRTSTSTSPAIRAFDRLRRRRAAWPIRTRRTHRRFGIDVIKVPLKNPEQVGGGQPRLHLRGRQYRASSPASAAAARARANPARTRPPDATT